MGRIRLIALATTLMFLLTIPAWAAKDDVQKPKEFGIYVKSGKTLKRLLPNVVFEEEKAIYVESNNPPHFPLKDVTHFVIYGTYDMNFLTMNPLLFFQQSPVGKSRFIFGREVEMTVTKKGDGFYLIKPKGLLGRGYYALWINDSAWDFIVE